ncbi:hypothetical protein D2910_08685 [Planomicrobium okeanokoites]|nr:hypothetical protein D2910_08685 [Planomicrobium okeanokoites]
MAIKNMFFHSHAHWINSWVWLLFCECGNGGWDDWGAVLDELANSKNEQFWRLARINKLQPRINSDFPRISGWQGI